MVKRFIFSVYFFINNYDFNEISPIINTMKKHIIIPLTAVLISSFLLLTSLDNRIFDLFLRTLPPLTEDPSVLLIRVDDSSLENVGLFPWPRDIMANAIVFLREMGAETVSFDLSYLDNSPMGINYSHIEETLPKEIEQGFSQINNVLKQVMDGFSQNIITPGEAESYKEQMLFINKDVEQNIQNSLGEITIDVDRYFGKTLRFFNHSFLTLTMVTEKDIGAGQSFDMSAYDLSWIEENLALRDVNRISDSLTPSALGIIPTIPKLQVNARGAGFVNAPVDMDGFRRRLHLLYLFQDHYYGQFALVPLLEKLGNPSMRVTNNHIILENARSKGVEKNITIPRAQDGSILIKWPKKQFIDYKNITAWDLIVGDKLENILVGNLEIMDDSGFFSFWDQNDPPLILYSQAEYIKNSLFDGIAMDGIDMDAYRNYKKSFLESTEIFLTGPYEESILSTLNPSDTELIAFVKQSFKETREQYADLIKVRTRVSSIAEGAFCIVGVDATSMTDRGMTTFQEVYPNVGVHAVLSHMILSEEFLDDAPALISVLLGLILSFMLARILMKLDTSHSIMAGILTLLFTLTVLLLFFILTKRYVGTAVPLSSVTLTFVSLSIISFFQTIKEKSFLRSAFSRYLSPEVISEIISDPSKLNLGGEKREMTAIFTDIKGFSSFSEKLDPADLVKLLNMYLTVMSDIILKNRGTIDKYEGDAIIAFFGAPVYMDNHAALSCRTAIEMKKAENDLNRKILEDNLNDSPLFTRIGMNTGDMIVGNMGTANKMDYTIMGNTVNLAARLEGVNKQYETRGILISQNTRDQIGEEFLCRRLDQVRVVGLSQPIRIYELLDCAESEQVMDQSPLEPWNQALERYEAGEFELALEMFLKLKNSDPEDGVVRVFMTRCQEFLKNPPSKDWGGIYNLDQK
jgi:adenylate cyclase